jgi:hypothetical protein
MTLDPVYYIVDAGDHFEGPSQDVCCFRNFFLVRVRQCDQTCSLSYNPVVLARWS